MSDWREDNFLEKLAHSSPKHPGISLCPEAEILCAKADSEETETISGKLSQHMEHCPVCSDLYRRLMLFDQPASLGLDPDAIEVEKRLDSWLKGFLSSQSLNPQAPLIVSAPKSVPLRTTSTPRPFWNMRWALAAAAMVVMAVGMMYVRRSITAQTPAPMIAQTTAEGQSPAHADSPVPTEPVSAAEQHPQAVASKVPRTSRSSNDVSVHKATAPAPSTESEVPPGQAREVVAEAGHPDANASSQTPSTSPSSSPTVQASPVVLAPEAPAPATPILGKAHSGESGARTNAAPHGAPRSSTPLAVQLPAGVRIWLTLDSVTSQSEGRFQFRATLLLPVTASGTLLLDKGAQVMGSGQTVQNQTLIRITEIVTRGQGYKPSPASSGISSVPGSGKAVRFENGQVLEMWLDSASTFEAAGGSSVSPPN